MAGDFGTRSWNRARHVPWRLEARSKRNLRTRLFNVFSGPHAPESECKFRSRRNMEKQLQWLLDGITRYLQGAVLEFVSMLPGRTEVPINESGGVD